MNSSENSNGYKAANSTTYPFSCKSREGVIKTISSSEGEMFWSFGDFFLLIFIVYDFFDNHIEDSSNCAYNFISLPYWIKFIFLQIALKKKYFPISSTQK